MGKLTTTTIKNLTEPGSSEDGEGLRLVVKTGGRKSWILRFQVNGRRREMGLGAFPAIGLKEARIEAAAQRRQILDGRDPIEDRKARQEAKSIEAARKVTFETVALAYIESQRPGWRSPKQAPQWESSLRTYAFPVIGHKAPAEVTTEDVLAILRPIWDAKQETARRVRNRIEIVLNAAKAQRLRDGENVAQWRGHLELLLTRQKTMGRGHHAALPWQQVPAFWQTIKDHNDLSACAVRITILSALRTSEVIGARWREIDLAAREWVVPADRMKGGKAHRVPLSAALVAELESLPRIGGSEYLFPGQRGANHMSNLAMLQKVRGLDEKSLSDGGKGWRDADARVITIHGFRSSFRDWAAECSSAPNHVAEMVLAHAIGSDVEKAYRRGDLLAKRADLMQQWADFVTNIANAKVVHFKRGAR